MSERNKIKDRLCRCGRTIRGKAHKLKECASGHLAIEREAAAQAVLKKLHEDMQSNVFEPLPAPVEVPLTTEIVEAVVDPALFSSGSISETTRMADEGVLNAEGD
jgi:hypothetical protein